MFANNYVIQVKKGYKTTIQIQNCSYYRGSVFKMKFFSLFFVVIIICGVIKSQSIDNVPDVVIELLNILNIPLKVNLFVCWDQGSSFFVS